MTNQFCQECINHFQRLTDNQAINLLGMNSEDIGKFLECRNGSALFYAPAGNFPHDPIVTVCGLATSIQAKDLMLCEMAKGSTAEDAALKAVYHGRMAINLALMLKALGADVLIPGTSLTITGKKQDAHKEIELAKMNMSRMGQHGYFSKVPDSLHLTQATCCWSKGGKSTYLQKWSDFSRDCREKGYLRKILSRFLCSKKSRLFMFLGKPNLQNLAMVEKLIRPCSDVQKVKVLCPPGWNTKKFVEAVASTGTDFDKIICFIHHPANTAHVYNNKGRNGSSESLMYRFFKDEGIWGGDAEKYGNTSKEKVELDGKYYAEIQEAVTKIMPSKGGSQKN